MELTNVKNASDTYGMAARIRDFDWSVSPIGPVESWSPTLRSTVNIMMANRFPLLLWWGPEYISIYNDAYAPILGTKHPHALGLPVRECWSEVWHVLKPLIDSPFQGGPSTWIEDFPLEINRHGFVEETHFTVAYSPVPDETVPGGIGGVLATVHEISQKVIGERRVALLRDLGVRSMETQTAEEACSNAVETMSHYSKDLPFASIYLSESGKFAGMRLVGSCGQPIKQARNMRWPLDEVIRSERIHKVENLADLFTIVPRGPWSDPPRSAVMIPIRSPVAHQLAGVLVAGISSHLKFDENYSNFLELLANQLSTTVANARAYEEERRRAEALAEIDRAKTIFFNNISHEFRTPLTLMLGPLEDMKAELIGKGSVRLNEQLDITQRNAQRMLRLVNALLDFSRIEAGRIEASYEKVDVGVLTEDLVSTFRSAIEKAGLKLIVEYYPIRQPVYVDKGMWEKIVVNLVSNAFKYTERGSIMVELRENNKHVQLIVRDTGIGIPAEELPKIFERFYRAASLFARTHEGTGIGLSMVKELVNLHRGTVSVESKLGTGTTFVVTIPTGKDHLPKQKLATSALARTNVDLNVLSTEMLQWSSKPEAIPEKQRRKNNTKRILLVDDNTDMRMYLKRMLLADYEVIDAANGKEALNSIRGLIPDLVIADVMMPVMDGFELLQKIRSNPSTAAIPTIILSARAGEEAVVEGIENGADDYLIKPFSARELTTRISNLLKISEARQKAELEFKNLIMQSPVAIGVLKGNDFVITIANDAIIRHWGKGKDVIGKPFLNVVPEAKSQGIPELLKDVLATGDVRSGHEVKISLERNGVFEDVYVNFTFQPYRGHNSAIIGVTIIASEVTSQALANLKLEANEKQFRNVLLESPNIFVILKGCNMIIDFVNEPLLVSWHKNWDIVGKPLLEVLPELKDQPFPRQLEDVYNTGKTCFGNEVRAVIVKEGKPVHSYFNYVYQPIFGSGDKVTGITIMATDVTEQVQSRKRIEESERQQAFLLKLSDALRSSSNPLYLHKEVSRITMDCFGTDRCYYCEIANGDAIIRHDASRGSLPSVAGVYPLDSFPLLKAVIDKGKPFVVTDAHTDLMDEALRTICLHMQIVSFIDVPIVKNGKPAGLLCLTQGAPRRWTDFEVQLAVETAERTWVAVERANAEEALAASEERYRYLFNSIDEGFCTVEVLFDENDKPKDYRFMEINPAFERQTGIKNAVGRRMREIAPQHEEKWFEVYGSVALSGKPVRFENAAEQLNRFYDVYAFRIGDPEEKKVAIIFNDITKRKQIEDYQKRFSEKLEQLVEERTRDLQETNIKLHKSNDELEQFTYIASHDLQEPLRKIQTFSSLLENTTFVDIRQKGLIDKIDRSAKRMTELIKDLLDFSRLKYQERFAKVDLSDIVRNVLEDFDLLNEQKRTIVKSDHLPVIEAIPLQMNQLFTNLVGNALKFSSEMKRPRLSILCEKLSTKTVSKFSSLDGGKVYYKISIKDNGIGFDQDFAEQIFQLFQRLHSKSSYGGSGIGLTICKRIVEENHHGIIYATGKEGKGSVFHVILPVTQGLMTNELALN